MVLEEEVGQEERAKVQDFDQVEKNEFDLGGIRGWRKGDHIEMGGEKD